MGLDPAPPELASHTLQGRRASSQDHAMTQVLPGGGGVPTLVAGVADGVGSVPGGAAASSSVLDQLMRRLQDNPSVAMSPGPLGHLIAGIGQSIPSGLTTLAAIFVHWPSVVVAAVGDSRVYRITEGRAVQVSRDHNLLQDARDRGLDLKLNLDVADGPVQAVWANALTRVLGQGRSVAPEIHGPFQGEHDLWLAVTDGVWGSLTTDEISERCWSAPSASDAVGTLLEDALAAGSTDNVGAAVVAPRGWPFRRNRGPRR